MPGIGVSPYPVVEDVLNYARSKIADAGVNSGTGLIQGDVLQDSRPGTIVLLQSAYEYVQMKLGIGGVEVSPADAIIAAVPAAGSTDPSIFVNLGFSQYNDGVTNWPAFFLPPDLKMPLWIQQRIAGTQQYFIPDPPAPRCNDGLPTRVKSTYSPEWEWRGDAIWMCGAVQALDMRIRYNRRLPRLAATNQNVLIVDSWNAMGTTLAWMFTQSLVAEVGTALKNEADGHIEDIIKQSARAQQRGNHRRQGYSQWRRGGWGTF